MISVETEHGQIGPRDYPEWLKHLYLMQASLARRHWRLLVYVLAESGGQVRRQAGMEHMLRPSHPQQDTFKWMTDPHAFQLRLKHLWANQIRREKQMSTGAMSTYFSLCHHTYSP